MIRELYKQEVEQTALNVTAGRIDSLRRKHIRRSAVRLYDGTRIGIAGGLGDLGDTELDKRARENLSLGIPYHQAPVESLRDIRRTPPIFDSEAAFQEEMEELLAELSRRFPKFSFSEKLLITRLRERLENEAGAELEWEGSKLSVLLTFKQEGSGNILDGMLPLESGSWDRQSFLDFAASYYEAYQGEELPLEAGSYPVIFPYYDEVHLLKYMKELNGLTFGSGASLFSGKLGQQLFSPAVSLYQTRSPEDGFLGPFFDAEGSCNEGDRYPLIEAGRLRAPYTDKKYAARYDLPLTGAASCVYDGVPSLGTPALALERSEKSLRELCGDGPAVYLALTSGGDFTPEGHFATPAQLAFLYRDGEFLGRLPQLNISSGLSAMYGEDFLGLSGDDQVPCCYSPSAVFRMEVSPIEA